MFKKSKTYGLPPETVADLLNIGMTLEKTEVDPDQQRAELLQFRLAEVLPFEAENLDASSAILVHLCREAYRALGKTIGKLLHDPHTPLTDILRIKQFYKNSAKSGKSDAEYDTRTAVYYAAIASALVFHNQKICKFSYKSLHDYFSLLSQENWIPPDLVQLFAKACQCCQEKMDR